MTRTRQTLENPKTTYIASAGTNLILTYSLTKTCSSETASLFYGIHVSLKRDGIPVEEIETLPISGSETYVQTLIDVLLRNRVTPMCLLEVLDDLMELYPLPDR